MAVVVVVKAALLLVFVQVIHPQHYILRSIVTQHMYVLPKKLETVASSLIKHHFFNHQSLSPSPFSGDFSCLISTCFPWWQVVPWKFKIIGCILFFDKPVPQPKNNTQIQTNKCKKLKGFHCVDSLRLSLDDFLQPCSNKCLMAIHIEACRLSMPCKCDCRLRMPVPIQKCDEFSAETLLHCFPDTELSWISSLDTWHLAVQFQW